MQTNQTIKSVKVVGRNLEITILIDNGYLQDEISWTYTPAYKGKSEMVSSETPMENVIGFLLLGLLDKVTCETEEVQNDCFDACEQMELELC